MKRYLWIILLALSITNSGMAQVFTYGDGNDLRYEDAAQFRIINRGFTDTQPLWTRIPDALKDSTRPEIFELAQCSAGIGIRFRTNSKTIAARYLLREDCEMSHMAYTGIKGADLYMLTEEDDRWHYIGTARPKPGKLQQRVFTSKLTGEMREYTIYLPLYDGVEWFEIGIEEEAIIEYPQIENPKIGGKIAFFGTSILQGGCASRVGFTQTNQLQRLLGRECINMGFSGSAKLYEQNARTILAMDEDIDMYVIDPLMNNPREMVDSLAYPFMKLLVEHIKDKPILMVQGEKLPSQDYNTLVSVVNADRNAYWKRTYEQLKNEGYTNLYFMDKPDYTGFYNEGTVDNTHLTDYGFAHYVNAIKPYLRRLLGKVTLIGHRGCDIGVENTMGAFQAAEIRGYKAIETDVRVTKDGAFVLSHDSNLERLGHKKVIVEKSTLKKLKSLPLRQTRNTVCYKGTIATLDEYLDFCKAKNITAVIELKQSTGLWGDDTNNIPKLLHLIHEKGMIDHCIIISFNTNALQQIRLQNDAIRLQYICSAADERRITEWCQKYHIDIDLLKGFSREAVYRLHQAGLKVNCWTIDDESTYNEELSFDVDMVTTNSLLPLR